MLRILAAFAACSLPQLQAAAPRGCIASVPLGSFQLWVQAPGRDMLRPVQQINVLGKGEKVLYRPIDVPRDWKKSARVALVLVPANDAEKLAVFEPEPADRPSEWTAPFRAAVAGVVFGPQGLSRKKVSSLIDKDRDLVSQLADYADQTTRVEGLIQTLASAEQTRSLDAALSGFAAQYGTGMSKLDRTAPTDQQAAVLLHALNPALGAYDPLAPDPSHRLQQSAGLAASVAGLFLGSNVGLAAGGAALVQNLRTLLFPGTDFRSALVQPAEAGGMTLCARREGTKSRTRLAYLWAHRLPDAGPPSVLLPATAHLPLGIRSTLPASLGAGTDGKLVSRAHDWQIVPATGGRAYAVPVTPAPDGRTLDFDLAHVEAPPGDYRLRALWDWDAFEVSGTLHLHRLDDLESAAVAPASADALVQGRGPVEVRLTGPDFQFVDQVLLAKQPAPFTLPAGARGGPQFSMAVAVDTNRFPAGRYQLALHQPDGAVRELPVRVLPPNPSIDNLPLRANLGEPSQTLVLRGAGLDRIESIQAPGARIELGPPSGATREASIHLQDAARKGDRLPVALKVEGLRQELRIPGAIEVLGPRPGIGGLSVSQPEDLGVELRPRELAAGSFVSFALRVEHVESPPTLRVSCREDDRTIAPETLRPGEKHAAARLESAGDGLLFLSLDPGAVGRSGCSLQAGISTEASGDSDAYALGRVVRLPRIDSFTMTDERAGDSAYAAIVTGHDLETVARTGWDARAGLPVMELPRALAGEGQKQTLKIALPWPPPAPHAPLYIWLRGEEQGRATRAKD